MGHVTNQPLPLQDYTVLSLRPRGQHASLRAAAARRGGRLAAISTLAITPICDSQTKHILRDALRADIVLFTSPNAVHHAARCVQPHAQKQQMWLAVGEGSQRALQRHGIDALAPSRMDSEGLLGMQQLNAIAGKRIGLITAPGGRGLLEPELRERGADVIRANVYQRSSIALAPASKAALQLALTHPQRCILALSSAEALHALLQQAPPPALFSVWVSAASARLAQQARTAGFTHIVTAASARPAALLDAATKAVRA